MDKPLMRLQNGKLFFLGAAHGSSSLFQDSAGAVWLIDPISHELFRYTDGAKEPQRLPAPDVAKEVETWCLGEDLDGSLLACVEGHGLGRYTHKWERVNAPELPQESPLSLMKSDAGRLWLGYPRNQIVMKDSRGYRIFDRAHGLELNTVLAFYDSGELVLVGGSDGLAYYDGIRFHSLLLRTPSLLRGISGIVKDSWGDLWLNAASGVVRLPEAEWRAALKDPRYAMDFQLLNERNGLIGAPAQNKPTPSAIIDKEGTLWFATSGHLVSLDPAAVRQQREAPKVLLQSIRVNGAVARNPEDQPFEEDVRRLKTLEFDYIGIDLNSPDRVTYQYILEGQDKDWQDAGNRRQAYYTNLAPGHYQFRVRAASGTGKWNEMRSPLHLVIKPAFYQTAWFFSLCSISLAVLVGLFYRLRVQYLTRQLQERLEARAYERVRIARDLHDTLLQGVQALVLRFHGATEQLPEGLPAREMLKAALNRADRVIGEGRDKVRELRDEGRVSRNLPANLSQLVNALGAESGIHIKLAVSGEPRALLASVEDELHNIAREALTNAVRHAKAENISLALVFGLGQFRLSCSDDGVGASAEIIKSAPHNGH